MRKHDSEVISTTSSTSKGSSERRKNRFSIRRIFYAGRTGRTKSRISLNSNSSAQSDYSFVVNDRDHVDARTFSGAAAAAAAATTTPHIPSLPPTSSTSMATTAPPATSSGTRGSGSDKERECPLCLMEFPMENFPEISTCYHRSCLTCLKMYLRIEITESRINIACPECAEKFHPNDIRDVIQDQVLMAKYEDFMVRRVLVSDPDARWCPAPDCGYAVIAKECASCPKIRCERPGCDTSFCYHCKQFWHPNKTCDAARAERALDGRNSSITYSHDADSQIGDLSDSWRRPSFIKPCPRCSTFIIKMNDGSCNHMTCPVCGAEFCWLCMKEISDLHYLSPSGCTFWGKKPWSRKKKILWQLGTLVGAPVGITLLAGIAVPAMIIGIPVWVGKKIHSKYETSSRHRRNMAIAGGVAASILVSPVVAGLAVGIGVPILMGYVYGVVPISLCRSGGCGVRTTNSGGVRFEFEENETGLPSAMYSGTDTQSVGPGQHVANPSIAPSIGEASVGMANSIYSASGSHMDRVGIIRDESDRDSASNRAIAGASLNGSMSGSTYATVIGMQVKLEVQAELESDAVAGNGKRASFSSESANFSIGEKSIGEKSVTGDDVSTRALAGSLANYRLDSTSITTPTDNTSDTDKASPTGTNDTGSDTASRDTGLSQDERKKTSLCPGSPLSGCGSLCDHEDSTTAGGSSKTHHSLRCRKCRRAAKLLEKPCSEQMNVPMNVHFSDQVSLQSFQAEDAVLDLPMGKHDIDSLSEIGNENYSSDDSAYDKSAASSGKKRSNVRNNSEPAILLTEVENDKPRFVHVRKSDSEDLSCESDGNVSGSNSKGLLPHMLSTDASLDSFASSSSMKFDNGDSNHEDMLLSKCRSEEFFKDGGECGMDDIEKSKSAELFSAERNGEILGGSIKRVRRKSCELAIQDGRISPLTHLSNKL